MQVLFDPARPVKPRMGDFMFYKELDRYISSKPIVREFKATIIYRVGKALLLELWTITKVIISFISGFIEPLYKTVAKIKK